MNVDVNNACAFCSKKGAFVKKGQKFVFWFVLGKPLQNLDLQHKLLHFFTWNNQRVRQKEIYRRNATAHFFCFVLWLFLCFFVFLVYTQTHTVTSRPPLPKHQVTISAPFPPTVAAAVPSVISPNGLLSSSFFFPCLLLLLLLLFLQTRYTCNVMSQRKHKALILSTNFLSHLPTRKESRCCVCVLRVLLDLTHTANDISPLKATPTEKKLRKTGLVARRKGDDEEAALLVVVCV